MSYATRHPDYQRIPALTMKGQWLAAAGFATGTEVDLKVMNGCIVITARQPEPELTASAPGRQAVGAQAETGAGVNRRDRRAKT